MVFILLRILPNNNENSYKEFHLNDNKIYDFETIKTSKKLTVETSEVSSRDYII